MVRGLENSHILKARTNTLVLELVVVPQDVLSERYRTMHSDISAQKFLLPPELSRISPVPGRKRCKAPRPNVTDEKEIILSSLLAEFHCCVNFKRKGGFPQSRKFTFVTLVYLTGFTCISKIQEIV